MNEDEPARLTLHPPKAADEKFIGNCKGTTVPEHMRGLKTVRLARPAYSINGELLDDTVDNMSAVFINVSEGQHYGCIMEARLKAVRGW